MSTHRIRFKGGGPEFLCDSDDTLLHAALRNGLGMPYECSSGGCGTCRVQLVEGELSDLWPQAPGLPQRARERGFHLACQSRPRSDCTVHVRSALSPEVSPRPRRRSAKLLSRVDLTADMAVFTCRADGAAEFMAGQFALLRLPGVTGDRAYSMSNLPNAEGIWQFIVKRMVDGSGSTAMFDRLAPGDELTLDGPYGMAYLRADSPRDIVCIAGGSGLSPVLSILSAAARCTRHHRRLNLYYGGRRPADLCVPAVLDRDPMLRDRIDCVTAISDSANVDASWTGERGFIHEVVRRRLESAGNWASNDYYFCGPPAMTDAVQRMLLDLHVPTAQTFYDRFV